MTAMHIRTDLPVLLLHDLDSTWAPNEIDEALRDVARLEKELHDLGHAVIRVPVSTADLGAYLIEHDPAQYIVFNWCESIPGVPYSEAQVAQILYALGFTYTGSTAAVLALSWDKAKVKQLLRQRGIPTPRWQVYETDRAVDWSLFPAIVKPAHEHCSYGVTPQSVVLTPDELCERIAYVLDVFQQPALVEDFIDGREFHVTVWGNGEIEVLPPAEMDFTAFGDIHDRLCTFDSKFCPGSLHYERIQLRLPAPLDDDERRRLEQTARAAYQALHCRDYGRLDIRLRDGVFYVLDVNPNPDISSETSTVYAATEAGYSYGAMASYLINLAAKRHPVFRRHWF
ncbi:MAG: D-alanine--D-alanine ligase family protein [Anaerolineae bacterium]